jgi:hypothetical protein
MRITDEDRAAMRATGVGEKAFKAARRTEEAERRRRRQLDVGGYGEREAVRRVEELTRLGIIEPSLRAFAIKHARLDRRAFETWISSLVKGSRGPLI